MNKIVQDIAKQYPMSVEEVKMIYEKVDGNLEIVHQLLKFISAGFIDLEGALKMIP